MTPVVSCLTDAVAKRVRFSRTFNELRRVDRGTGRDPDMFCKYALTNAYACVCGG